jgi:hypothetical protein
LLHSCAFSASPVAEWSRPPSARRDPTGSARDCSTGIGSPCWDQDTDLAARRWSALTSMPAMNDENARRSSAPALLGGARARNREQPLRRLVHQRRGARVGHDDRVGYRIDDQVEPIAFGPGLRSATRSLR